MTRTDQHSDPIGRVRAADPARDAVEAPPVDVLLALLDADEQSSRARLPARSRRTHAARRRLLPLGGGIAVVGALAVTGVVALTGSGGGRLDVVAQARAALAPHGAILYLVTRSSSDRSATGSLLYSDKRRIGRLSPRHEQWSTADPLRYRMVRRVLPFHGSPGGTLEEDFAGGTLRRTQTWDEQMTVQRLPKVLVDQMTAVSRAVGGVAAGDDPVQRVREMLDSGRLRAAGDATYDGRRALRLIGNQKADRDRRVAASTVEYLVDPTTYRPLLMTTATDPVPPGARRATRTAALRPPRVVQRTVFEVYERIPLNERTARLLRIGDAKGKRVVRQPSVVRRATRAARNTARRAGERSGG